MEAIKQKVEKLNNLYFKLNGMYQGCIECLKNAGYAGKNLDYLTSILSVDYVGIYLEMIDDATVELIGHSLDCDSYEYNVQKDHFKTSEVDLLNSKLHNFSNSFLFEMNGLKGGIPKTNFSDIYDDVCDSMARLVKEIQRNVFYVVN